ncbi:DUF2019 domain-containing protein [Maribacter flavus]|nr:DUF2019 domain-containing protein [Maribacter flavus]
MQAKEQQLYMNKLISEYIDLATEHGISIENGDSSKSNKIHSRIEKITKRISQSEPIIKNEFYGLLKHSNLSVRLWAAVELIGTDEKKSMEILQNISADKGIIGLTSQTLIDMWKKGLIIKNDWNKAST